MTLTLEQAMGLVGDMLVWPDPKDRTNAADILAAMQQAAATITAQAAEIERLKTTAAKEWSAALRVIAEGIIEMAVDVEQAALAHASTKEVK